MHSFEAAPASSHHATRTHPALTGFADETWGTLACLIAYLCTPALIAMLGIHLWINCRTRNQNRPPKQGWTLAAWSIPAFTVSQFDLSYKTDAYQILRRPEAAA